MRTIHRRRRSAGLGQVVPHRSFGHHRRAGTESAQRTFIDATFWYMYLGGGAAFSAAAAAWVALFCAAESIF